MEKANVIAIDGPSGSGKSTIAKLISDQLDLTYLDTGAMFRAIAYASEKAKIDFASEEQMSHFLKKIKFEYAKSPTELIVIDDMDLTDKIREHHVSKLASKVSQNPVVREFLKLKQREIAQTKPSVLEGRDIGTVIFPNALLKIFLTADAQVRAQRRYEQLIEKDPAISNTMSKDQILNDIIERDKADENRAVAPLLKANDAIEVNTSDKTIEEVVAIIKQKYENL